VVGHGDDGEMDRQSIGANQVPLDGWISVPLERVRPWVGRCL
jgi:hypothetical protein